jgi:hypothetical protein
VVLADVAIQGAAMFGLVLESKGKVSFENVTAKRLGFGGAYYCPEAHGKFVVEDDGDDGSTGPWWNDTQCAWPSIGGIK